MLQAAVKPPPRYSCGHLRTEKGKHRCPKCRADAAKNGSRPMSAVAAERRAAAIARITAAIDGTSDWKVIAARLGGVSRQRVFQLLRWLEANTDSPEARLFREAQRLKREFYRVEKKNYAPGTPMCMAQNPETGHACLLRKGHAGEHYNDYRRHMETWSG